MNFWSVRCNVAKVYGSGDKAQHYMGPEVFGVIAETIEDAIAKVKAEIPGTVIWAVNHGGKVRYDAREKNDE
jgi:hypothetical protein